MKGPSPLLGYNTNVRHAGKLYHIQTEDSGVKHPHIITHLFADGGRIIATRKTSYTEHVGSPELKVVVKRLMQEQHKGMFIALRDGMYDEGGERTTRETTPDLVPAGQMVADVAALEKAAARYSESRNGKYQSTQPASIAGALDSNPPSIFGGDLLSEKSLDEVILTYLAEDLSESDAS